MQNAIKEMCNLICYTKIEGTRKRGEGTVHHISQISTLMHVFIKNLDRDQKQSILHVFFSYHLLQSNLFLLKNRMVGECYEIYIFLYCFDIITIIFRD